MNKKSLNSANISTCCANVQQISGIIVLLTHASDLCSKRSQQQLLTVSERREVEDVISKVIKSALHVTLNPLLGGTTSMDGRLALATVPITVVFSTSTSTLKPASQCNSSLYAQLQGVYRGQKVMQGRVALALCSSAV